MQLLFKKEISKNIAKKYTRYVYRLLGIQAIEVLYYMHNRYPHKKLVESIEGLSYLKEAYNKNNGIILISAHIGNFTHISLILQELGFLNNAMIMRKSKDIFVEEKLSEIRKKLHINWFNESYSKRNAIVLARFLKNKKGILILLTDQRHQKGIPLIFFDSLKKTPVGPASFSLLTKAPIIPFFAIRTPSGRSHCIIKEPIYPEASLSYEENILRISNKINKILEEQILQNFDQWLCLNRWWK